nr:adult cuticle protein 1-like [Aedes albopictus]
MKCVAAVVIMVISAVADASYVPSIYAHHGHGYAGTPVVSYANYHDLSYIQPNHHHAWAHHGYAPVSVHSSYVHHAPASVAVYDSHWDHHHVHAAPVVPHHGGATYVAANPGAVHKAPLPGHVVNQKSLNLAPAAGTW